MPYEGSDVELRSLPADEAAVRRYVEELWLPYHRELATMVEGHELAADVDVVAEEVAYRLERLQDDEFDTWIAVDRARADEAAPTAVLTDESVDLAGFVATEVDRAPPVFDRPDRLVVADLYVRQPYRGTGHGRALLERAADRARTLDCAEITLEVDEDNEPAIAAYEELGFEHRKRQLGIDVEDL